METNMKKIFLFLFIIFFSTKVYSANPATGDATEYIVEVQKVELCEDSACSTSTTVGDTSASFNIASSSAGAEVGTFAKTTGLPLGTTFTHLRVTVSRTFTISGSVTTDNGDCMTDGGTDAGATQLLVGKLTGSAVSTSMFLPNTGSYGATDGTRDGDVGSSNIDMDYSSPQFASSMTVSGSTAAMIYQLANPYTVKFKSPLIKIKFKTNNAVGAFRLDAATDVCSMYPEEPLVTIDIQ